MNPSAPTPRPVVPQFVTPTLMATYRACPLRAAYALDPRWSYLRRGGLRAALGIAAHAVVARAGTGVSFDDAWEQETARVRRNLAMEWAPATPPSIDNWPGAALTKARLAKGWSSRGFKNETVAVGSVGPSASGGPVSTAALHSGAQAALPWRERWLQADDLEIAGRPDLVERTDHLRVVDLKTGVGQRSMTAAQRTQLLFYCVLVQKVLGELPTRAAVETAAGQVDEIEVVAGEVLEVQLAALQVRADLEAGAQGAKLAARPAEDSCATCPFRVLCGPFLEAYRSDWRCGAVRVGTLKVLPTSDSPPLAEVEVQLPIWARGHIRLVGLPIPRGAEVGQIWAFSDFEGHKGTAMARWNSILAPWHPSTDYEVTAGRGRRSV